MTDQQDRQRSGVGDDVREGIRAGIGILGALKDAIEETVQDMLDRGELSEQRARETVRTTMERAQAAFDDARMRLDFVPRREFEELRAEVEALRARVDEHAAAAGAHHDHGSGSEPAGGADAGDAGPDIPISEG